MVGSILRNSDALIWLSQLRNKSDYAYQHSINVCILMLNLGRQLRLSADQLVILGIAGLLQDIGVLLLPEDIVNKHGALSEKELAVAKSHVQKSVELISDQSIIPHGVLSVIWQHHERYDGTGYPKGLKGNQISLYGAIAGISDCFDAIVSTRPYKAPRSTFQALMLLYESRNRSFSNAVVERFIQSIGIYPIGSLVELNTEEVAIVIEQRKERRLKPRLLVVLDSSKQRLSSPFTLDLLEGPKSDNGTVYSIKEVLNAGAYDIDPAEFYLV
jgi:HD-GYP domain-containing protein (c-di-GMP phosphodiesterase class II)